MFLFLRFIYEMCITTEAIICSFCNFKHQMCVFDVEPNTHFISNKFQDKHCNLKSFCLSKKCESWCIIYSNFQWELCLASWWYWFLNENICVEPDLEFCFRYELLQFWCSLHTWGQQPCGFDPSWIDSGYHIVANLHQPW